MEKVIKDYLHKHGYGSWEPRAALFDMDGVLYDSMANHAKAWHDSMASYGVPMSVEEAYAFEGMRGFETIKIVAGRYNRRGVGRDVQGEVRALCRMPYSPDDSRCPPPSGDHA